LNEAELGSLVDQGKSSLYECIPEAAQVYEGKIKSDPVEAKDFLERVTVLPIKPQPQHLVRAANLCEPQYSPS